MSDIKSKAIKIIIVEDEANLRLVMQKELQRLGYDVQAAPDGEAALKLLEEANVDVILSDINMPRMNGLEMIEVVKKEPQNAALPIIVLTSEGQPALIDRAKKAGAKGWIVKPFKADLLVAAVKKLLVA